MSDPTLARPTPFHTPVLETERLLLRRIQPDELEQYHTLTFGDADVMRYIPDGLPRPLERTAKTLEAFDRTWVEKGFSGFGVVVKETNRLIGHCGLMYLSDYGEVELFYAIGKAWWGRGYVTEAARAVLQFGFETVGLDRVIAIAYPENMASRRVMEKVGLTFRGQDGRYFNMETVHYAVTRDEWAARHAGIPYGQAGEQGH